MSILCRFYANSMPILCQITFKNVKITLQQKIRCKSFETHSASLVLLLPSSQVWMTCVQTQCLERQKMTFVRNLHIVTHPCSLRIAPCKKMTCKKINLCRITFFNCSQVWLPLPGIPALTLLLQRFAREAFQKKNWRLVPELVCLSQFQCFMSLILITVSRSRGSDRDRYGFGEQLHEQDWHSDLPHHITSWYLSDIHRWK